MWIFGYGSLVWKVDFPYLKKVIGYIKGYERRFYQASIDHRGVPEKPGRVVTLLPSEDPEAKVWGAAYKIHSSDIPRVLEHLDHREIMGYEKVPVQFYPVPSHPENIMEPASPLDYDNLAQSVKKSLEANGLDQSSNPLSTDKDSAIVSDDSNASSSLNSSPRPSPENNGNEIPDGLDSDNESHVEDIANGLSFTVTMYYGSSQNEHYIGTDTLESMAKQIFEAVGPSGKNRDYLFNLAKAMRNISEEAVDPHLAQLETAVRDLEVSFNTRSPGTPMEL